MDTTVGLLGIDYARGALVQYELPPGTQKVEVLAIAPAFLAAIRRNTLDFQDRLHGLSEMPQGWHEISCTGYDEGH